MLTWWPLPKCGYSTCTLKGGGWAAMSNVFQPTATLWTYWLLLPGGLLNIILMMCRGNFHFINQVINGQRQHCSRNCNGNREMFALTCQRGYNSTTFPLVVPIRLRTSLWRSRLRPMKKIYFTLESDCRAVTLVRESTQAVRISVWQAVSRTGCQGVGLCSGHSD